MSAKGPKGILVYLEDYSAIQQLSLEERGQLFTAMLEYGNGAVIESSDLTGGSHYLWPLFKSRIDAQFKKYEETCERNRKNRASGDQP